MHTTQWTLSMHTPHANSSSSLSMAVQLGVKCCGLFGTNICQPNQNLPSIPSNEEPPDSGHAMHEFLIHAGQVFEEAHFLASSIPNASTEASQHAILQLETIEFVLNTMEMGFDSDSITPMKHDLNTILSLLQQHIKPSDQSATGSLPWIHTGKHGQPQLDIDLDTVDELQGQGASLTSIAMAMGVTTRTIYNHMQAAGRTTTCCSFTQMSNEDLDDLVSEMTLNFPFVGIRIIQGHLEARGIHLPYNRIRESLHRVDKAGLLMRYIYIILRLPFITLRYHDIQVGKCC